MTDRNTLKSLEIVLESFLDRVLALKEERLSVLEGINRLDNIIKQPQGTDRMTEETANWFAGHNYWLTQDSLRPGDYNRIGSILSEIKKGINSRSDRSPVVNKISSEIDRWEKKSQTGTRSLTLKRGSETSDKSEENSISLFNKILGHVSNLYLDSSASKKHLLSVLDGTLDSARLKKSKETLLLSGFIIYYLKLGGYKVEPYVKRLKEAEKLQKESRFYA
ncbi:MAG: hypothetical protein U9R56_05615 [candidate division Zixibacteria bacterium]|nr:hypothetical protein [candidate division Zixibacteria bacterium]